MDAQGNLDGGIPAMRSPPAFRSRGRGPPRGPGTSSPRSRLSVDPSRHGAARTGHGHGSGPASAGPMRRTCDPRAKSLRPSSSESCRWHPIRRSRGRLPPAACSTKGPGRSRHTGNGPWYPPGRPSRRPDSRIGIRPDMTWLGPRVRHHDRQGDPWRTALEPLITEVSNIDPIANLGAGKRVEGGRRRIGYDVRNDDAGRVSGWSVAARDRRSDDHGMGHGGGVPRRGPGLRAGRLARAGLRRFAAPPIPSLAVLAGADHPTGRAGYQQATRSPDLRHPGRPRHDQCLGVVLGAPRVPARVHRRGGAGLRRCPGGVPLGRAPQAEEPLAGDRRDGLHPGVRADPRVVVSPRRTPCWALGWAGSSGTGSSSWAGSRSWPWPPSASSWPRPPGPPAPTMR